MSCADRARRERQSRRPVGTAAPSPPSSSCRMARAAAGLLLVLSGLLVRIVHGWCRKVGGKLENWRKLLIVKHSERRCAAAERSLRHETSYGIDVAQSIFR